jgi:hypothetical protein
MSPDDVQQDLTEFVLSHSGLDNDDLLAQAAYFTTQQSSEEPGRELALNLWHALGVEPRETRRRRGRPRKRPV